jgi:hypothetical protein
VREVRGDSLPLLYIHDREFWYCSGHVCPGLPENNLVEDVAGPAINYDVYDPTLHTRLEDHVVGDLDLKGCYPDWTNIEKRICSNQWRALMDNFNLHSLELPSFIPKFQSKIVYKYVVQLYVIYQKCQTDQGSLD